jgi:hypothetical protein
MCRSANGVKIPLTKSYFLREGAPSPGLAGAPTPTPRVDPGSMLRDSQRQRRIPADGGSDMIRSRPGTFTDEHGWAVLVSRYAHLGSG